jgi:hypothetical protein
MLEVVKSNDFSFIVKREMLTAQLLKLFYFCPKFPNYSNQVQTCAVSLFARQDDSIDVSLFSLFLKFALHRCVGLLGMKGLHLFSFPRFAGQEVLKLFKYQRWKLSLSLRLSHPQRLLDSAGRILTLARRSAILTQ